MGGGQLHEHRSAVAEVLALVVAGVADDDHRQVGPGGYGRVPVAVNHRRAGAVERGLNAG